MAQELGASKVSSFLLAVSIPQDGHWMATDQVSFTLRNAFVTRTSTFFHVLSGVDTRAWMFR